MRRLTALLCLAACTTSAPVDELSQSATAPAEQDAAAATPLVPVPTLAQRYVCDDDATFDPLVEPDGRLRVQVPGREDRLLDPVGTGGRWWSNGLGLHDAQGVHVRFDAPIAGGRTTTFVKVGLVYTHLNCRVAEAPAEGAVAQIEGMRGLAFAVVEREPFPNAVHVEVWQAGVSFWAEMVLTVPAASVERVAVVSQGIGSGVEVQLRGAPMHALRALTESRVGRQIGVVVDGLLVMAPIVQEPIEDGDLVISGGFGPVGAQELAALIRGE